MKRFFLLPVLCIALVVFISNCYAQTSTSLELINNAKQYDNKTVSYRGEVIGDIMVRGDYAWLHVNDGIIAIGIWVPRTMVQEIRYAGDYHKNGDIVEVSGMFHRSCLEHGGDLELLRRDVVLIEETPNPPHEREIHLLLRIDNGSTRTGFSSVEDDQLVQDI